MPDPSAADFDCISIVANIDLNSFSDLSGTLTPLSRSNAAISDRIEPKKGKFVYENLLMGETQQVD